MGYRPTEALMAHGGISSKAPAPRTHDAKRTQLVKVRYVSKSNETNRMITTQEINPMFTPCVWLQMTTDAVDKTESLHQWNRTRFGSVQYLLIFYMVATHEGTESVFKQVKSVLRRSPQVQSQDP